MKKYNKLHYQKITTANIKITLFNFSGAFLFICIHTYTIFSKQDHTIPGVL